MLFGATVSSSRGMEGVVEAWGFVVLLDGDFGVKAEGVEVSLVSHDIVSRGVKA